MKHSITKDKSLPQPPPAPANNSPARRPAGQLIRLAVPAILILSAVAAFAALNAGGDRPVQPMNEVWIPGGDFVMGDEEFPDARPRHTVHVDGFWMDETEVTNEQFAVFAQQTGYRTIAERTPRREDFPTAPPEKLVPGAGVFNPDQCPPGEVCLDCATWWEYRAGANWRHPEGPGSDLKGREKHPVVHIAWEDAVAYAKWAGKRLPTEAEWECAARGGLEGKRYYWGDELRPGSRWMANIWQGAFPRDNRADDGFAGTSPVKSFPPSAYGLYDMAGNVWEWCADWYRPDYYASSPKDNPPGPESSIDPEGRGEPKRVQRGGSFLCSDNYCIRYRAGARGQGAPDTGLSHTGFRCVRSIR